MNCGADACHNDLLHLSLKLLPEVGDIKKVTIRENRYPFLSKVGEWNKDTEKSGDTLVEKCCHFFDLFRLIISKEMSGCVSKGKQVSHLSYCSSFVTSLITGIICNVTFKVHRGKKVKH